MARLAWVLLATNLPNQLSSSLASRPFCLGFRGLRVFFLPDEPALQGLGLIGFRFRYVLRQRARSYFLQYLKKPKACNTEISRDLNRRSLLFYGDPLLTYCAPKHLTVEGLISAEAQGPRNQITTSFLVILNLNPKP